MHNYLFLLLFQVLVIGLSSDGDDTMERLEFAPPWPCGTFYENKKVNLSTVESLVGGRRKGQQSLVKDARNVRCGFMQPTDMELAHTLSLLQQRNDCPIVLATTIFNNYDKFNHAVPPEHAENSTCFFTFMDKATCVGQKVGTKHQCNISGTAFNIFRHGVWNVVVIDVCRFRLEDIRRASRIPKMLGHRFFPEAHYFISIDAREKIMTKPTQIIQQFLIQTNKQFLAQQHPSRSARSVYDEGNLVARVRLAAASDIQAQLERYKNESLPNNHRPSVHEMGFFAYDLRSNDIKAMLCAWFDEYMLGSVRDQVCWSFVVWKLSLTHRIHSVPYREMNPKFILKGAHRTHRSKSIPIACPSYNPLQENGEETSC
uniref:TOD1/MUCI70 glycosyltransferase-like domain-containing protein n=1 Tax=Aureoumbra lagunensis TaxID=44058 RepID=A0A7S3K715_9STRA